MSDVEDDILIETSFENSLNFENVWNSVNNIESFLSRTDYIGVRGTSVEDPEELNYEYDIDGVTILWKNVGSGLSLDYTHFDIASRGDKALRPIYPILKKHVKLQEYSGKRLEVLRLSLGCQLIYYGGWETWLGFLPQEQCPVSYSKEIVRRIILRNIAALRIQFQKELQNLLEKGEALNTLSKNNIFNLNKLFVLPSDRRTILKVFQHALETTDLTESIFYPAVFTFRFGEKCRSNVELPISELTAVNDICVHLGICVSSDFHYLFWCRSGVNKVIGERGHLSSAYSFFECVNFQSNLDHRSIDISGMLRSVCQFPECLRFVQMYSDLPHRRPQTSCHPISGSIIMVEGILAVQSRQKICREANEYLSELKNNFAQVRDASCRLEFVICLPSVSNTIIALDLVNRERMLNLFKEYPMIAPFSKMYDLRVTDCLREVGMYLQSKLQEAYNTRKGTGDSLAVWKSYQTELACEKLLWGHPFSGISRIYAINLGPGLDTPTRSLTDQMGFLCLENCFSCCSDENTTPPLNNYTKNLKVQAQIARLFGIFDIRNASSGTLGKRIILCLLRDLYEIGSVFIRFEDFLLLLQASAGNGDKQIVGGITIKSVLDTFVNSQKCKWPMVFKSLQGLLQNNSTLEAAMREGIQSLKLGYFPAVRNYDSSRNEGLNWRYTYGYWVFSDVEDDDSVMERKAGSYHVLVLSELEKRKLCHSSAYGNSIFPWIKPCLEKLPDKKFTSEETVVLLTYATCICLLMNGRYVEYLNLSRLERSLPVPQRKLQTFEILSRFRLESVKTVNVFRIHPSISHSLANKRKHENDGKKEQLPQVEQKQELEENQSSETVRIPLEDDFDSARDQVNTVQSRHLPMNVCRRVVSWKPAERMILTRFIGVGGKTVKQCYEEYKKECRENEIPDHPFDSFRRQLTRLNKT